MHDIIPQPPTPPAVFSGPEARRRQLYDAWLAGRKATTVRAYRSDLTDYAAWAGFPDPTAAVEALFAMAGPDANYNALCYRNAMIDRGLSSNTVARRLSALKSLGKLARIIGACTWTLEVEAPTPERYRDVAGPGEQGWAAVRQMAKRDRSPQGLRDRAIAHLGHDMALRRGEIVGLDLAHVHVEESWEHGVKVRRVTALDVLGKGQDSRLRLSVPPTVGAALLDWIDVRGATPGAFFWRLDRGAVDGDRGRLTGEAVRLACKRMGEAAGLTRPLRPHGLRHAGVTACLEGNGGNLRHAAKFSRHAKLDTLVHYDDCRVDIFGRMAALVAGD